MLFGNDADEVESALDITQRWDEVLGTNLNLVKSKWWPVLVGMCPGPRLLALTQVRGLTYLGTDFTTCPAYRNRAATRVSYVLRRARLTQCLPASSRPEAVADATAALWLEGFPQYGSVRLTQLAAALAAAVRGRKPPGRVAGRSRVVEHMIYEPGECRTLPALRGLYLVLRRLQRYWTPSGAPEWAALWRRRQACVVGPVAAIRRWACWLGIVWVTPTSFRCADKVIDITTCPEMGPAATSQWWHEVREALRAAVWAREAKRRPKDYVGSEHGIRRGGIHALRWMAAGPTVMAAGMWTAQRLALCQPPLAEAQCVRCGAPHETKEHRLWECPVDQTARDELFSQLPEALVQQVPAGLPPCLRRCALIPQDFPWSDAVCHVLQLYIVMVAARAGAALAAERWRRDDGESADTNSP